MYEPFFGFHRRPFSTAPDPGCFFAGESVREVLSELTTCVERGQGIALLTAPAGMGKSLLCQRLISNLKAQFATIYLGNANFPTRRSLLQAILLELGDEYSRSDEAELRHTLQKRLHGLRRQYEALLLVVDEAHLFEAELLEEIRTLADIAAEGLPLVRIVLSGQLELEERLTDRRFDALNQRLGTHVYLGPLTQNESAEYLHHRIEQAGGDAENVFTEDGFSIVVRASGGVPRCLNQLADHSLLLAFAADEKPVKEKTVRDALDDLKQLPLHWNDVSEPVSSSTFEADDNFDEPADDDFTDTTAEFAAADSENFDATHELAGEGEFLDKGEVADEAAAATFGFEASAPTDGPQDASSAGEVAEFENGEFDLPPSNAAALAAAADVFDETEEFGETAGQNSDAEATDSLSPAEESSFEAAWEATYDSDEQPRSEETATFEFAAEDQPAEETGAAQQAEDTEQPEAGDPWFACAEPEDATPSSDTSPVEVAAGSEEVSPAADTAVLEFGAEPDAVDDRATIETVETETVAVDECEASEQQPASPEASGETSVEAVLSATTAFTEIFIVDHYSALEEPLSADIAWPKSEYFRREGDAQPTIEAEAEIDSELSEVTEQPECEHQAELPDDVAEVLSSETDDDADVATEAVVAEVNADAEPNFEVEAESEQPSVFEFAANDSFTFDETAHDEASIEDAANDTQITGEIADAEDVTDEDTVDDDGETRLMTPRESLETVFEFGVDPRSETDFESDGDFQATFEEAESLLSEFSTFTTASDQTAAEAGEDTQPEPDAQATTGEESADDEAVAENNESVAGTSLDEPVRKIDPSQSISTIDGMLEELSYDADDVGQAVNDASDEPERPSIEIESELLRTVDHSADPKREIEDEIGATMLDICLDTQSAIYEMTQQLRESSAARDVVEEQSDDDLPHIADVDPSVFDVVEPEAEAEEVSEPAQPSSQTPTADRSQPPKKRAFGSLFSDLRRRQE